MGRYLIDSLTADRLLAGALAPEDAPPGYAEVAMLLRAAHMPPTQSELARHRQTLAAMTAAVSSAATAVFPSTVGRRAGLSRLLRPRIAATLMAGALATFSGLAAAGALPGSLQHAAHVMFDKIGISVPDSDSGSGDGSEGPAGPSQIGPVGGVPSEHPTSGPQGGAGHHHKGGNGNQGNQGEGNQGDQGNGGEGNQGDEGNQGQNSQGGGGQQSGATSSAQGPKGLCNAWRRGRGGENGKKLSASAFRRLKAAAEAHGQTIAQYCGGSNQSNGNGSAKAKGNGNGNGKKNGKEKGQGSGGDGDSEEGDDPDESSSSGGGDHHRGGSNGQASHGRGTFRGNHRSPHDRQAPSGDAIP